MATLTDSEVTEDHPLLGMLQYIRDLSVKGGRSSTRAAEPGVCAPDYCLQRDPCRKHVREDPEM
jgi:hypothetical protein